jgi:hypothetical protein
MNEYHDIFAVGQLLQEPTEVSGGVYVSTPSQSSVGPPPNVRHMVLLRLHANQIANDSEGIYRYMWQEWT